MRQGSIVFVISFAILLASVSLISAFEFSGTVYDINGNPLNNTIVNITIRDESFSIVGYNGTTTNESGWFNMSVSENNTWMYQPVLQHFNATTGAIDFVGQSLPEFPLVEMSDGMDSNKYYLKEAGTINITAINETGDRIAFTYQVKDTKLGYSVEEDWATMTQEAVVYVPKDRNYSVMIYPNESLPVKFDWNNFSSDSDYDFGQDLSSYNATTSVVHKQFNCTETFVRVSGYIQNSSGDDELNWNEFIVLPFLLEPGDMIFLGEEAAMPINMSSWDGGKSDSYDLTTGFYNISLPASIESGEYILFATARNGTDYYGSFMNVTLTFGAATANYNFTMYSLMGTDWGSAESNMTSYRASDWTRVNISTARQQFTLVNASNNASLGEVSAHIEVVVNYSAYGAKEFTFMFSIEQSDATSSFYLPLLNVTGIKKANIYTMDYAPRSIGTRSAAQILANPNITMKLFDPDTIDGTDSDISMALYRSNSTCDVPNPAAGCNVKDDETDMDSFNPLAAVIGGGSLSFRMGIGGVLVHYANVDMLASGPPDALFEDNSAITEGTSDGFSKAMRFGSLGPTIYDYVMISMPYTEGSSSTTGLNESGEVNMSIPTFYDENWDTIWSATNNGTNATRLAANYTHYAAYQDDWQELMTEQACVTNVSEFNATNPCYIDTTNDRIWIRLPHFSGVGPGISGAVITADSSNGDDSSSGGGGGGTPPFWTKTYAQDDAELSDKGTVSRNLSERERIRVMVGEEKQYIGIITLTSTSAMINSSGIPQQVEMNIGDEVKFEVTGDEFYDMLVTLVGISGDEAEIIITSIYEEIPADELAAIRGEVQDTADEPETEEEKSNTLWIVLGVIGAIIILIIVYYAILKRR